MAPREAAAPAPGAEPDGISCSPRRGAAVVVARSSPRASSSAAVTRDARRRPPTTPGEIETLFDGIPQDRAVLGSPDADGDADPVRGSPVPGLQALPGARASRQSSSEYVRPGQGEAPLRRASRSSAPDSEKALHYVLAAGAQGKLWQFADALYANQGDENSGWVTDELLESSPASSDSTTRSSRRTPTARPSAAGELDGGRGGAARGAWHAVVLRPGRRRRAVRGPARLVRRSRSSARSWTTRSPAEPAPPMSDRALRLGVAVTRLAGVAVAGVPDVCPLPAGLR